MVVVRVLAARSVGHKGKFGHEFLEFEFRPDGKLRYANKCAAIARVRTRAELACF